MNNWICSARTVAAIASVSVFAASLPADAADTYPSKPVRLVVPFPAGGPSDVLARVLGQKLSEKWGQQVVVDNRPGGFTVIGAQQVKAAAPDGYTLLMPIDSTLTMNPFLMSKLPYDPLQDFTLITLAATQSLVFLANDRTTAKSVGDIVAAAKAKPGDIAFGSGTVSTQLAGEMFAKMAGVKLTHVPYKGSSETVKGILSGDVQTSFDGIAPNVPHIKSGKLRPLATTGLKRAAALPDVPTFDELGFKGYEVRVWLGLAGPAGLPRPIVDKIRADTVEALNAPDVKEKLHSVGLEPVGSTPEQFTDTVRKESAKFGPLIKELNIKLE